MKEQPQQLSMREHYRALVSLLSMPLGAIIIVRAFMVGLTAWTLIVLGVAFVALGIVRLRTYMQLCSISVHRVCHRAQERERSLCQSLQRRRPIPSRSQLSAW